MTTEERSFEWLEFRPRPKKDGLHDSGYRFIRLTGVNRINGKEEREELHQWSDHVAMYGPVNDDVTEDGTIRFMPWAGGAWVLRDSSFYSSALFFVADVRAAVHTIQVMSGLR